MWTAVLSIFLKPKLQPASAAVLSPPNGATSGKWFFAKDDICYHYSYAKFYDAGIDDFGLLHNLYTVFDGE
ncbi:MAG: hypothetical protein H7258_14135 [Ferruginibacter sp.]|nr:hypothetical protein [Ferruginibacter sp.]